MALPGARSVLGEGKGSRRRPLQRPAPTQRTGFSPWNSRPGATGSRGAIGSVRP
jgi:hypothetical protein